MPAERGLICRERKGESDHGYRIASGAGGAATAGGTLNTATPCAACKLLRRRCTQECPFCPYFSPEDPRKFASVHKVFGASNVSKMLMEVPKSLRAEAADSLVYEAKVRLRDPVYGCVGTICSLHHQVEVLQAQLNAVKVEIFKYKNCRDTNMLPPSPYRTMLSSTISAIPKDLSLPFTPPPSAADSCTVSLLENCNNIAYFG